MTAIRRPDEPIAQAHADAGPTETAAQARAATRAAVVRDRVLRLVADSPHGLTALEAYRAYCQHHGVPRGELYTVSPRLSELSRPGAGFLEKTTASRAGRAVYVATDKGRAWVGSREVAA